MKIGIVGSGMLVKEILPILYKMPQIELSLICGVRKTKVMELISNKGLLVGVFVAVLSFMVCSLTTDSMLTTTPIFCVLLGTLTGLEVEKN